MKFFLNLSKIILITYQSLKTLITIVKNNNFEIDLICFDEAHHILSIKNKELLFGLDDDDFEYDNYEENTKYYIWI